MSEAALDRLKDDVHDAEDGNHFAKQIAAIYSEFAGSQKRLGAEFEAAIFSDTERLYDNSPLVEAAQ